MSNKREATLKALIYPGIYPMPAIMRIAIDLGTILLKSFNQGIER
ncbi:hypothetical protein [Schnuerera sp.]|nr:hypothetical protein [Schnuerera sp.]HSH36909.1 hypothetical protein [Schnuerera sp.]